MASFHNKNLSKHDDYMTPKYAWENINEYIPKDKVIWEAFMGNGKSGDYLISLGCQVIHNNHDFFSSNHGEIIVSNPPFSKTKQIMPRLRELDKPFILIMPCSKICTSYLRENFKDAPSPIQIIIPRRRIQFTKLVNGKVPENYINKCNFDCFYYCYKMNLPRDIIWLD